MSLYVLFCSSKSSSFICVCAIELQVAKDRQRPVNNIAMGLLRIDFAGLIFTSLVGPHSLALQIHPNERTCLQTFHALSTSQHVHRSTFPSSTKKFNRSAAVAKMSKSDSFLHERMRLCGLTSRLSHLFCFLLHHPFSSVDTYNSDAPPKTNEPARSIFADHQCYLWLLHRDVIHRPPLADSEKSENLEVFDGLRFYNTRSLAHGGVDLLYTN